MQSSLAFLCGSTAHALCGAITPPSVFRLNRLNLVSSLSTAVLAIVIPYSFCLDNVHNQIYRSIMSFPWSVRNGPQNEQEHSPPKPRTLRLSPIPTSVDENRLREYLGNLECEGGFETENVLAFSLAPFIDWLVATVTFDRDPFVFKQCLPGYTVSFQLPITLDESREDITADCDFHGITPLYHPPEEPSYE